MPACSSHWEAQQDGGRTNPFGRGAARTGRETNGGGTVNAKPVSNRHHDELARKNDAALRLASSRWWN
jgi:hypothetical protein